MIDRINRIVAHLKETREILSQAEFAEKIGIQPSQISEMLSGKRKISERTVRKIVQSFPCVNSVWLITGEGEMLRENDVTVTEEVDFVSIPKDVFELIKSKDKQIDTALSQTSEVIKMLREELNKKSVAEDVGDVARKVGNE